MLSNNQSIKQDNYLSVTVIYQIINLTILYTVEPTLKGTFTISQITVYKEHTHFSH